MYTPATIPGNKIISPPSDDRRWRIVNATMRRLGHKPAALIETLHVVQRSFGYLDPAALQYVARSLHVPLSKALGVATFYSHFRLSPEGKHTCVICLGTACYIQGAAALLTAAERCTRVKVGETTADGKVSLLNARCLGACGIAPAAVFDGSVVGGLSADGTRERIEGWLNE
jgi:bidirectional [NiFe] hydrogenase diaphorase subunit